MIIMRNSNRYQVHKIRKKKIYNFTKVQMINVNKGVYQLTIKLIQI